MFRQFSGSIDNSGNATVTIENNNAAMEWDIYQISCTCGNMAASCIVVLSINGAFLCSTPQGSMDTATGPPDVILNVSDILTAQ